MHKLLRIAAVGTLFLGFAAATPGARGGSVANHTTYLTFSGAVALPGLQLDPGTYIFEVANPESSGNVVRVLSSDRSKIYLMAFTNYMERPAGLRADQFVSLGEAPRGMAPPVKAWFPAGSSGHQFIYSN